MKLQKKKKKIKNALSQMASDETASRNVLSPLIPSDRFIFGSRVAGSKHGFKIILAGLGNLPR